MRKIFAIVFALILVASFAACKKLPEGSYEADSTNKYGQSEGETISPELEDFIESFDSTDPAAIEQQFEQMLEENIEVPEMEFGEELVDDSNSTKIEVELNEEGRPDRGSPYSDIINSDEFTIDVVLKTKTNGEELKIPIVAMRKGKQVYFEFVMPIEGKGSMRINMLLADDGKCYLIFPALRAYMTMPGESMDTLFDTEIITEDATATGKYVETLEVEINNKTYRCDVYEENGVTVKQYYDNDTLKRIESISDDGEIVIMEINEISKKSDKSKFVLPKYFPLETVMGSTDFDIASMY